MPALAPVMSVRLGWYMAPVWTLGCGRIEACAFMTAAITDGRLHDVELHRVER